MIHDYDTVMLNLRNYLTYNIKYERQQLELKSMAPYK